MTQMLQRMLIVMTIASFAAALPAGNGLAQEKQKTAYTVTAADSKYTARHNLDLDDQPGHRLSLFEIHRAFPTNAPAFNGIRLKEILVRGVGDYLSGNGASTTYNVYVLENGDKFFAVITTLGQADATEKRTSISVGHITGGTGKFLGMQGVIRSSGGSDANAGMNETKAEVEYWFPK